MALLLSGTVAACSPTFDWRTVDVAGTGLTGQLPCRPGRFEREATIGGAAVTLSLLSCEAGGVTYGLATADVGDPTRVAPVLSALVRAAQATLHDAAARFEPFDIAGATPFPGSVQSRLNGQRADGRATQESLRVFARGTRVYEASAVGEALPEVAIRPFEDGLRFDLSKTPAGPR